MRLLLDTHVFLWIVTDDRRLRAEARRTISEAEEIWVSSASIWEIAIKSGLGKLSSDPAQLATAISTSGFRELAVSSAHAARVATLPPVHADPFDRLLIAQAVIEPLTLVTADSALAAYGPMIVLIS